MDKSTSSEASRNSQGSREQANDPDSGLDAVQAAVDALGEDVPRVQVVRYRPGAWFWWLLPVVLLSVAAIAYALGSTVAAPHSAVERLNDLRDDFDQDRMDELRAELTELRMVQGVDTSAADEVRATFRELQDEIASLEEEVAFYRSLMAPAELAKGLHIERMQLRPTERPRVVSYELVIAQTVARHAWQKGDLYFEVHGAVAGERAVLALTEIATIPEYPMSFRFRYFQNYSGEFTLPADFTPETVIVTLDRGDAGEVVQRRYDWAVKDMDVAGSKGAPQ